MMASSAARSRAQAASRPTSLWLQLLGIVVGFHSGGTAEDPIGLIRIAA